MMTLYCKPTDAAVSLLLKTKRDENDLDLVRAIESLTGMTVRRHYWQKGAKGCPKVLGVVEVTA